MNEVRQRAGEGGLPPVHRKTPDNTLALKQTPVVGHRATERKAAEGPNREGHEGRLAGRRILGEERSNCRAGRLENDSIDPLLGAVDIAEADAFTALVMSAQGWGHGKGAPSPSSLDLREMAPDTDIPIQLHAGDGAGFFGVGLADRRRSPMFSNSCNRSG